MIKVYTVWMCWFAAIDRGDYDSLETYEEQLIGICDSLEKAKIMKKELKEETDNGRKLDNELEYDHFFRIDEYIVGKKYSLGSE